MSDARLAAIDRIFDDSMRVLATVRRADQGPLLNAIAAIEAAIADRRRVMVFGNGGSASDAQHFAAEFVVRFQRERKAAPVIALTADTSILTAMGNDYAFDQVFARQIEALGNPGDIALAITTSGRSPNILAALRAGRANGLTTIALTGRDGGEAGTLADIHVNVADQSTARVQEVQRTMLHAICEIVEEGL